MLSWDAQLVRVAAGIVFVRHYAKTAKAGGVHAGRLWHGRHSLSLMIHEQESVDFAQTRCGSIYSFPVFARRFVLQL